MGVHAEVAAQDDPHGGFLRCGDAAEEHEKVKDGVSHEEAVCS